MRNGNRVFETPLKGLKGAIVHRGVSQGGRKLSPEKRLLFWHNNAKKIEGFSKNWKCARFTLSALAVMRRRSLVLVVNPKKPQVWTPSRIEKFGQKFTAVEKFRVVAGNGTTRRGNLKL